MSDDRIDVCPACDSSRVRVYANGKFEAPSDTGPRYGCDACGARFETPDRRPRHTDADGLSGLSKRLSNTDADEVGP